MEGIEDMILTLWSLVIQDFDMDSALGIQHWRPQRQHFHRAKINKVSKHKVLSTMRILSVVSVQVEKKQGYGHLKEIIVRRADQYLYKLKEGDFSDLHLNDIEDMLLLIAQNKLSKLDSDVIVDFVTALKLFTQGIVLKNKIGTRAMVIENKVETLTITTFSFSQEIVCAATSPRHYISRNSITMSSPDHSTSNNKDAFSSNILDYVSTIPDYSPASSGKTYSN
nr:hypothetical protein [Tanacetum cinerariifolium]